MLEPKEPILQPGLYRIYWMSGGLSVAAVGIDEHGKNWVAPTNWLRPWHAEYQYDMWDHIDHVVLITTQNEQQILSAVENTRRIVNDKSGISDRHYNFSSSESVVAPTKE